MAHRFQAKVCNFTMMGLPGEGLSFHLVVGGLLLELALESIAKRPCWLGRQEECAFLVRSFGVGGT